MGEEEDAPLADIVGVYSKIHPDDREQILNFYQEVIEGLVVKVFVVKSVYTRQQRKCRIPKFRISPNGIGCG